MQSHSRYRFSVPSECRLRAEAPRDLPPGRVHLIVVRPDDDEAGAFGPWDVSQTWRDELGDVRQDIYTLSDGQPVDASR